MAQTRAAGALSIDVLFEERLQIARTMEHANDFDSARVRDVEDDVTSDGDASQCSGFPVAHSLCDSGLFSVRMARSNGGIRGWAQIRQVDARSRRGWTRRTTDNMDTQQKRVHRVADKPRVVHNRNSREVYAWALVPSMSLRSTETGTSSMSERDS